MKKTFSSLTIGLTSFKLCVHICGSNCVLLLVSCVCLTTNHKSQLMQIQFPQDTAAQLKKGKCMMGNCFVFSSKHNVVLIGPFESSPISWRILAWTSGNLITYKILHCKPVMIVSKPTRKKCIGYDQNL